MNDQPTYGPIPVKGVLPEGFHKVSVVLNEAEFRRLRHRVWLQPHATWSEAIREAMGLPTSPYGFKKALRQQSQTDNNEE